MIPGFFDIVHTENPGIAFGLLADSSSPWRNVLLIGFSVAVLAVIATMLLRGRAVSGSCCAVVSHWCWAARSEISTTGSCNGTVTDFH